KRREQWERHTPHPNSRSRPEAACHSALSDQGATTVALTCVLNLLCRRTRIGFAGTNHAVGNDRSSIAGDRRFYSLANCTHLLFGNAELEFYIREILIKVFCPL